MVRRRPASNEKICFFFSFHPFFLSCVAVAIRDALDERKRKRSDSSEKQDTERKKKTKNNAYLVAPFQNVLLLFCLVPLLVVGVGEIHWVSYGREWNNVCGAAVKELALRWDYRGHGYEIVTNGTVLRLQLRKATPPYDVVVDSLPTIPSPLVCPVKLARVNLSFPLPGAEELPASGVALWLESVNDSSYNSGPMSSFAPVLGKLPVYCCSAGSEDCACAADGSCSNAALTCVNGDACVSLYKACDGASDCTARGLLSRSCQNGRCLSNACLSTIPTAPKLPGAAGCPCSNRTSLSAKQRCTWELDGSTCDTALNICTVTEGCAGREGTGGCACRAPALRTGPCVLSSTRCNPATSTCETMPACSMVQKASIAACIESKCSTCACRASQLACLNALFCYHALFAAQTILSECTASDCVECGRRTEPCFKLNNDLNAECNANSSDVSSLNVRALAIASEIGAKTELTANICASLRKLRVCYATVLARHLACSTFSKGSSSFRDAGARAIVEGSFPSCDEESQALVASIDCDFCDPIASAPSSVVVPGSSTASSVLSWQLFALSLFAMFK